MFSALCCNLPTYFKHSCKIRRKRLIVDILHTVLNICRCHIQMLTWTLKHVDWFIAVNCCWTSTKKNKTAFLTGVFVDYSSHCAVSLWVWSNRTDHFHSASVRKLYVWDTCSTGRPCHSTCLLCRFKSFCGHENMTGGRPGLCQCFSALFWQQNREKVQQTGIYKAVILEEKLIENGTILKIQYKHSKSLFDVYKLLYFLLNPYFLKESGKLDQNCI